MSFDIIPTISRILRRSFKRWILIGFIIFSYAIDKSILCYVIYDTYLGLIVLGKYCSVANLNQTAVAEYGRVFLCAMINAR